MTIFKTDKGFTAVFFENNRKKAVCPIRNIGNCLYLLVGGNAEPIIHRIEKPHISLGCYGIFFRDSYEQKN